MDEEKTMMTKMSVVVWAWVLCAPLLVGQGQYSDTLSSAAQQQRPQQPQPSHAHHPIPGMQMPSAQQPTPSQQGVQMPEPAKHARDENAQALTLEHLEQIALS